MGCTSSVAAFAGRYSVNPQRELGSGSQGRVFLAKDRRDKNRQVAVKRSPVFSEAGRQALEREALIMRDLDHPNICRLLDIYHKEEAVFFVMELCTGGDLADLLLEEGRLPEKSASRILQQVAGGLAHAHSRGIAHRDVKPENICFCDCGGGSDRVKLIDWGMSSYFHGSMMTACVGSVTYTAPEVLESLVTGKRYTEACDLWSLGVVAYTVLFGKFPFWGERDELLEAAKLEDYPTPEPVWQELSEDARDFIRVLIRYEPEDRLGIKAVQAHPWLRAHGNLQKPPSKTAEAAHDHPTLLSNVSAQKPPLRSPEAATVARRRCDAKISMRPPPPVDEDEPPSEWPMEHLSVEASPTPFSGVGRPATVYLQGRVVSL